MGAQSDREWKWHRTRYRGGGAMLHRFAFLAQYTFVAPCWLPALLFALLPSQRLYAWALRRRRARRAAREGLCVHCHYDLRATPDPAGPRLAVCPECGRKG